MLSRTQLTPDIAPDVAAASTVVFVDASSELSPGEVAARRVSRGEFAPPPGRRALATPLMASHHLTPETLLALAAALYGRAPEATLVSVGVESTELGMNVSDRVAATVPAAVELVFAALARARPA